MADPGRQGRVGDGSRLERAPLTRLRAHSLGAVLLSMDSHSMSYAFSVARRLC